MEIVLIILLILFIIVMFLFAYFKDTNKRINEYFNNGNVIVYGAKGKGKDLLFQKRIILNKKNKYLSNIDYGYNGQVYDIRNLSLEPNTYENFINGNIEKLPKCFNLENLDFYLSDGGVFLPCQFDSMLHKKYPSFPIYYALSRHLYNSNIHVNCQSISRLWKAIREQADRFIRCVKVIKLPFVFICKIRMYDKYESALNNLLPMKVRICNQFSKAQVDQYNATNGEIVERYYIIRKKDIIYNTRHFQNVVFDLD